MTKRAVICKGDPTTHGGRVLEGSGTATVNGRPIALKGYMTFCPLCNGNFPIVEGAEHHTFSGEGTAVEGMKTSCGAVLIATTTKGFMEIDVNVSTGAGANIDAAAFAKTSAATNGPVHSGAFQAVDAHTGLPVANVPYCLQFPDGSMKRGMTDSGGYTERVTSQDSTTVALRWESGIAAAGSEGE